MCISAVNCPDSVYLPTLVTPSRRTSRSYYLRNVDQGVPLLLYIPPVDWDVKQQQHIEEVWSLS